MYSTPHVRQRICNGSHGKPRNVRPNVNTVSTQKDTPMYRERITFSESQNWH